MIIERKNEKQIEQAVKDIKLFDFTMLSEGNWEKVFSMAKKYLPYENMRKPFLVEVIVEGGKPFAKMWFVAGEEKLAEHCLKFDLLTCYINKDKKFLRDEDLTKVWQGFLGFRFKFYKDYLATVETATNV